MDNIRMYCFQVGSIKLPFMKEAMPMYCYLIEHPKGRVLVDTGAAYEYRDENTIMEESDSIICQLAKLGYTPDDIDYLVISHLHMDHAGYMKCFPNTTILIRKAELQAAWWPEVYEHGFDLRDIESTRNFHFVQLDPYEDYDIFMDGRIVLIDTCGHSRGHQSVVLDLPNSGKIVLAIDAAPDKAMLDRGFSGRPFTNSLQEVRALRKIKHMADSGYQIFYAHDPENLHEKLYPQYYD